MTNGQARVLVLIIVLLSVELAIQPKVKAIIQSFKGDKTPVNVPGIGKP